ncbi:unnamed protein product, partial [Closterium sp. Naga37s-1]
MQPTCLNIIHFEPTQRATPVARARTRPNPTNSLPPSPLPSLPPLLSTSPGSEWWPSYRTATISSCRPHALPSSTSSPPTHPNSTPSRHPSHPYTPPLSPQRVVAFISYGYDLINFQPNMQHLLDSLGAVPILGRFYVDYNLTRFLHSPQLTHILSYTDPYFFRERLSMPKLLIAASNDEFFSMDDSYFYYNGLPRPTLLKIVANLDHMVIQKSYW